MINCPSFYNSVILYKKRTVLFILMCLALISYGQKTHADSLLIKNVTVIDATGSAPKPEMSVLVVDGVIKSIKPVKEISTSEANKIIDASGMYLIPGLWDMHVHIGNPVILPLFIANGVTGVRVMWGGDMHYKWRKRVGEEGFISPRFYIGSAIIDGDPPIWPGSIGVKNAEQGRAEVNKFYKLGADFIKVYSKLNRSSFFAIADECKKLGISFAGHVPNSVSAAEASNAGLKSIEHLTRVELPFLSRLFYGDENAKELYRLFIKNGTWQCPTLTVTRNIAYMKERKELDKDRLSYYPKSSIASWDPDKDFRFKNYSDAQWEGVKITLEKHKKIVADMNKEGVRIIAGTDVSNPYCFAGFSLHDELELLVEAGLSPMQALQASTRSAAEFMNMLDKLGTVEKGKTADLVLLRANPLEDIHNTTKIEAVVFNGKLYARDDLDKVLAKVRRDNMAESLMKEYTGPDLEKPLTPGMKRYISSEGDYTIDVPGHWISIPYDEKNNETGRFSISGVGLTSIFYKPKYYPRQSLETRRDENIQYNKSVWKDFIKSETALGDRKAVILDFNNATMSVRVYTLDDGGYKYDTAFIANTKDGISEDLLEVYEQVMKSYNIRKKPKAIPMKEYTEPDNKKPIAAGMKRYITPYGNYTVDVPGDWRPHAQDTEYGRAYQFRTQKNDLVAKFYPREYSPLTLEKWCDNDVRFNTNAGFTMLGKSETDINGRKVLTHDFSKDATSIRDYFFKEGDYIYSAQFYATSTDGVPADRVEGFERVMKSINILK